MTKPIVVSPDNKEEEPAAFTWPMGSSISLGSSAGNDVALLGSSSIFSMDHLQASLNKDEVLVEKHDVLMDSVEDNTSIVAASESKSVVSEGDDDGSGVAASSGGNLGASSTIYPLKPFWYKGFLKTNNQDEDKVAEAKGKTSPAEEEEPTEETLAVEEEHTEEEDVVLEEVLDENPAVDVEVDNRFEEFCRTFQKERVTPALKFCKEQWVKARDLVEPLLDNPEFVATCCAFLGCLCVLGAVVQLLTGSTALSTPKNDLRAFVLYEKSKSLTNMEDIEDLETDVFNAFARSACVKAGTVNATKDALFSDLRGIPDNVRDDVVEMAVKEGVTQLSSLQDSKADIVDKGKAYSFMAFWSTAYNPNGKHQSYETCVMVTGVVLTVAETVAEWTLKQEKYQVGVQPCYCGPFTCAECPIFDTRVVKWPILERRSLSLKKQKELRRWMIDEAIQSAEHLIASGGAGVPVMIGDGGHHTGDAHSNGNFGWNPMASLAWTSPSKAEFLGDSANNGRSEL